MRVFVICTGRCGSVTFSKACCHAKNFKSLHEPFAGQLASARETLQDRSIYIDNRLCWMTGSLRRWLRDDDLVVWLRRRTKDVAASMNRRWRPSGSLPRTYADGILMGAKHGPKAATDLVTTQEDNIRFFLLDVPESQQLVFDLEKASKHWPRFWKRIAATGKMQDGLKEFSIRHKARQP